MPNIIACRLATYGPHQDRAWTHLPSIGIQHIEMPVPEPCDIAAVRQRLADHGLTATSLQGNCQIAKPDVVDDMRMQLYACSELGAKYLFLSVKAADTPRQDVWDRLRGIGDRAAAEGLIVVIETHPDLVTNGEIGRQTMQTVNHPNIGINYDTGNVYYYNRDVTAVGELAQCIEYVRSVHLKETNGGYETWHFPALGQGVVDFPEIFRMLNARGFTGPFTMELEGIKGVELDEAGYLKMVEDSVAYLRRIGAMS
jgi:sugar phosphate isomerase/epimerase